MFLGAPCGAGGGQRAAAGAHALEAAIASAPRTRRCRAQAQTRADADGIDIVEVQAAGDGRAVRAALEALRNKRREREIVGFYSGAGAAAVRAAPAAGPDPLADLRARHQADITTLRTRLNGRLSKASAYSRHCDRAIRSRDATVAALHEELTAFRRELSSLVTLAADSAADPKQASYKFLAIAEQVKALQASVDASTERVNVQRVRSVSVCWRGMAEDVRVMGSFDSWTHGVPLSPDMPGSFCVFAATLHLLPGTYEIKFLVDGQWRLAADWPEAGEGLAANNLLVVGDEEEAKTLSADFEA